MAEDLHDLREQEKIHYEDVKSSLKNMQSIDELRDKVQTKEKILKWICQVNYNSNLDAASRHVHKDDLSGAWLVESQTFTDWFKTSGPRGLILTGACECPNVISSFLLTKRTAGTGKTVLCSKAMSHVLNTTVPTAGEPTILYFFFDFSDIVKQNVDNTVRALIHQLVEKSDSIPKIIQKLYTKHHSSSSIASAPSPEDWGDALISLLQLTSRPYVFIDALDECANSETHLLWTTIRSLLDKGGSRIKLLLTARLSARPLPASERLRVLELTMEEAAVNKDIGMHLKTRLENDPTLSKFGSKTKEMISSSIALKAGGM